MSAPFLHLVVGAISISVGFAADASSPFKCGKPLTDKDALPFLKTEYGAWKAKYLRSFPEGMCVTVPQGDISGNPKYPDVCFSEGNGYGMLIAVYMDDRSTFDGLWKFVQAYLDDVNGMNWMIWPGHPNPVVGESGATDADEDIAMALLVASKKWGGAYHREAMDLIEVIWQNDINHDTFMVLPGDKWSKTGTAVDTSYFSPAWYKVFAENTNRTAEWNQVIESNFAFIDKCNARNGGTGLTPQWTDLDCQHSPAVGKNAEHYWCDATRVALRMGISAAWHCDPRAKHQAEMLATFFSKQGAAKMYASDRNGGYTITGALLNTTDTDNACSQECFISTSGAVLVAGSTDLEARAEFMLYSMMKPREGQACYFCDTLRLTSLLFTTGIMTEPKAQKMADIVV